MKRALALLMLGFGITMAVIIGKRMSTDAMAVVVGVIVGVAASIPTSLLLVALLRRERRPSGSDMPAMPAFPPPAQPPVIVINPGNGNGRHGQQWAPLPPDGWNEDGGLRRLRVVGDDDEWME